MTSARSAEKPTWFNLARNISAPHADISSRVVSPDPHPPELINFGGVEGTRTLSAGYPWGMAKDKGKDKGKDSFDDKLDKVGKALEEAAEEDRRKQEAISAEEHLAREQLRNLGE